MARAFNMPLLSCRYIKVLETLRQLRLKQATVVRECQTELQYLKQNKEKAQEIRDLLSNKEEQLAASKDSVERITNQIAPLEVRLVRVHLLAWNKERGSECKQMR